MVRVNMEPGRAHAFHKHPTREELIYVLSGRAEQWVGREHKVLGPGEVALVPMGEIHGTYNSFAEELVFLAILSPRKPLSPPSSMFPRKSLGGRCALRTEDRRWRRVALHPQSSILHLQSSTHFHIMATIALLGTMDTKGDEHAFVAEQIHRRGHHTLIIDVGTLRARGLRRMFHVKRLPPWAVSILPHCLRNAIAAKRLPAMSRAAPIILSRLSTPKETMVSFRSAAAAAPPSPPPRCGRCRSVFQSDGFNAGQR